MSAEDILRYDRKTLRETAVRMELRAEAALNNGITRGWYPSLRRQRAATRLLLQANVMATLAITAPE